jgi:hypothetical protein
MNEIGNMSVTFNYRKMRNAPLIGSMWHHRNGNRYRVLMFTNTCTDAPDERYPVMVVYQNQSNGTVWSRRLDDWHRSMTEIKAT